MIVAVAVNVGGSVIVAVHVKRERPRERDRASKSCPRRKSCSARQGQALYNRKTLRDGVRIPSRRHEGRCLIDDEPHALGTALLERVVAMLTKLIEP